MTRVCIYLTIGLDSVGHTVTQVEDSLITESCCQRTS